MKNRPFFQKYLETQLTRPQQDQTRGGLQGPQITLKWPSDNDEANTDLRRRLQTERRRTVP